MCVAASGHNELLKAASGEAVKRKSLCNLFQIKTYQQFRAYHLDIEALMKGFGQPLRDLSPSTFWFQFFFDRLETSGDIKNKRKGISA